MFPGIWGCTWTCKVCMSYIFHEYTIKYNKLEQCIFKFIPNKNQMGLILINIKVQHPYCPSEVFGNIRY